LLAVVVVVSVYAIACSCSKRSTGLTVYSEPSKPEQEQLKEFYFSACKIATLNRTATRNFGANWARFDGAPVVCPSFTNFAKTTF